ncbi:MAG: sodium:solute symporter family protein [Planctomycetota bacterium]|jgi:SSS family solute:Na+ symporter
MILAQAPASSAPLYIICGYLAVLVGFGFISKHLFRSSSSDYFVASRSIGPFLLLMSVFGTTMTAFALVGSTGKAYDSGIGVYGLMASASGIIHSLVFFLIGIRLWAIGKRFNYVTQIQYFRNRFDSNLIGYLLFPVLVGLVIPYLLIGIVGAGSVVQGVTTGIFPEVFEGRLNPNTGQMAFVGAIPSWLTGLVICGVVLMYVIAGGVRAAAMANAVQTIVFMIVGVFAFYLISGSLGGVDAATQKVQENAPELLTRESTIGHLQFLTYCFVPLSVGMFPHLFQHWLTAKSAKTFRTTVIAHPIFIMIVWVPCVLIGIWAAGIGVEAPGGNSNAILAKMVGTQLKQPLISGLLTAGILAAIMSSLDSQFVCLGTIFTHDIVIHAAGKDRFNDKQKIALGRGFIVLIVAVTYLLSLFPPPNVFDLAVWCFSGFASLFPLVVAAVYWRRATREGAIACVLVAGITWFILFYQGLIKPTLEGTDGDGDYLIFDMMPVAVMITASTAALVVVSLLTKAPDPAKVEPFFNFPKRKES